MNPLTIMPSFLASPIDKHEAADNDDDYSPGFDEDEIYYPTFCLTEVPNAYFDEFNKHAGENEVADVPWIEITTSQGPQVLDDLRANASSGEPSPTPFKDWTIPRIYEFYKSHLRPRPDGSGSKHFTSFTFFAIDRACIRANPPQCIVCSDAPDFGEGDDEVKLKTFRIGIAEVMPSMAALEMLSMTPSEVRDRSSFCLKVQPQPMLVASASNAGAWQLATPAEGRSNKRAGIRMAEGLELTGTNRNQRVQRVEQSETATSRRTYPTATGR